MSIGDDIQLAVEKARLALVCGWFCMKHDRMEEKRWT